jgi:uncharacterized membrane protein SpoIIM required for sporulation
MSDQEDPPEPRRGLLEELFDRRRVGVVLGFFLVELALFAVGLLTPISSSTQQSLTQQAGAQFAPLRSAGFASEVFLIFTHNLTLAVGEMVPLLGALLLAFSIYTTGLVAQALVAAQGLPGTTAIFLFAFPYSFIELSAYAIAAGAGVMLIVAWRGKRLRREMRVLAVEGGEVVGVLLLAATMETTTTYSPLLGFALWVPTVPALAALWVVARRRGRRGAATGWLIPPAQVPTGAPAGWAGAAGRPEDPRAKAFEDAYRESHPGSLPPTEEEKEQDA